MSVSKRTRFEVLRRDNHTCRYCRGAAPDVPLTVDHVTPVALGGTDDPSNLVAACRDCNAGKSSSAPDATLVADVEANAIRWAGAVRRAAELMEQESDLIDEYVDSFILAWFGYLPNNFEQSIAALYRAGLPQRQMLEAVTITRSAYGVENRFRYFCGVAWKRVGIMQEIARDMLATEERDA